MVHALRERDTQMSGVAGGALAAGFLGGVSEPSLYGIHLRYKKVYQRLLAGCGAGGITIAVLGFLFPATAAPGVTTTTFAFTSLLTIPVFDQMWVYTISIAVAFAVSAILVIMFDYRTPQQKAQLRALNAAERLGIVNIDTIFAISEEDQQKMVTKASGDEPSFDDEVFAPVAGTTVNLKNCGDRAFAMKALGEGLAIQPKAGKTKIVAPVAGEITSVSGAKHAYTIMNENNVGVLVHVGIDTVKLNGKGFNAKVKDGDIVKKGDVLAEVDLAKVEAEGYQTPVIITIVNTTDMKEINVEPKDKNVKAGDCIIRIKG